jgi:hypothetical protein
LYKPKHIASHSVINLLQGSASKKISCVELFSHPLMDVVGHKVDRVESYPSSVEDKVSTLGTRLDEEVRAVVVCDMDVYCLSNEGVPRTGSYQPEGVDSMVMALDTQLLVDAMEAEQMMVHIGDSATMAVVEGSVVHSQA